jgi:flagellar hook-associated protein 3 FlgL
MRVTFRAIDDGLAAISAAAEQFTRAQHQVETGKRMRTASDDPGAALRVIDGRTELGTIDSYTRSADTALSRISVMDTVLSSIVDKITEGQRIITKARGNTADTPARVAMAAEVQGLRDALLTDLNTTFRGTFLFSGADAKQVPYANIAGTWTYQGDATTVGVDIGKNRNATIAFSGEDITRGGDPDDILKVLDDMVLAVQAPDEAALAAGMAALSRMFDRTVRAQSMVGVDEAGIEEEKQRLSDFRLASLQRVSVDEDVNVAIAITEMNQADTAYRSALQAVGASAKVSLLDYLR